MTIYQFSYRLLACLLACTSEISGANFIVVVVVVVVVCVSYPRADRPGACLRACVQASPRSRARNNKSTGFIVARISHIYIYIALYYGDAVAIVATTFCQVVAVCFWRTQADATRLLLPATAANVGRKLCVQITLHSARAGDMQIGAVCRHANNENHENCGRASAAETFALLCSAQPIEACRERAIEKSTVCN